MKKNYYNSWLPRYKKPFGAIQHGEKVRLRFLAMDESVESVSLIIRKEGDSNASEGLMSAVQNEPGVFERECTLENGAGIYYYFFKIELLSADGWKQTMYYGSQDGRGGEGVAYNDYGQAWNNSYAITCFSQKEVPPSWYRESIFYQIFPDRFATHLDGKDGASGGVLNPKDNIFVYGKKSDVPYYVKDEKGIVRWDFFGGTLEGIIEKIPYLKEELGVTAIYLNPIFEARSNHRYDTSDYFQIDPMLGTQEDFRKLVETLHENGMRIVLDGVFSHVGRNSKYFNADGSYGEGVGAAQSKESPFYSWFKFKEWPTEYKSWWGIDDLPEIDKYNRNYQEYIYGDLNSVLSKWNEFDIDGWRLDVADELPDEFISGIRKNLDTYPEKILIGEVWEDASRKYSYDQRRMYVYGGGLQSCMNYPFRDLILGLLNRTLSPQDFAVQLTQLQENYPKDVFLNNFNNVGTHDTERILTMLGEDKRKVNLSFGLMCMLPGVPCFYYGDEAGLTGGKDPENRKFFPWDDQDAALHLSMKKWIHVRKENPVIATGEMEVFYDHQVVGIFRYNKKGYSLYIANPTDKAIRLQTENFNFTRFSPFGLDAQKMKSVIEDIEIAPYDDFVVHQEIEMQLEEGI